MGKKQFIGRMVDTVLRAAKLDGRWFVSSRRGVAKVNDDFSFHYLENSEPLFAGYDAIRYNDKIVAVNRGQPPAVLVRECE